LPYYYTLFFRAHEQGSTVVRPLFFEYPTDVQTFAIDTQFLVGPALLVSPVLQEGATSVNAYIPPGNAWYDYYTGDLVKSTGQVTLDAPIEKINAHVRGGYIIPRQQDALTTVAQRNLPYNLVVAVNNGSAQGELYLDDDESLDSVDSKKYTLIEYNLAKTSNSFVLKNNVVQHGYDYDVEMDRVEFYGVGSVCKAQVNGQSAQFSTQGSIIVVSTANVRVLDNLTVEVFTQC
jgi:alpha-glucosidase (family GH31 glycosyl hydrolase)